VPFALSTSPRTSDLRKTLQALLERIPAHCPLNKLSEAEFTQISGNRPGTEREICARTIKTRGEHLDGVGVLMFGGIPDPPGRVSVDAWRIVPLSTRARSFPGLTLVECDCFMRRSTEKDDADLALMQRVATNEEAAVEELYDRFGSLVYRMAYQAMPTRADAEDAVQEVFVRLWKTAKRYDPKRAALVTWVMLISRRHLVDKLRRTQARVRTQGLESTGAESNQESTRLLPDLSRLEQDERYAALLKKVATLPELQRTVVMRAYLGGQTLRQIGEELDTPIGTVKSALSRALVRLRERTGEEGSS
jgi:RNA polymerase sigma-70 factor, ECF subfamily